MNNQRHFDKKNGTLRRQVVMPRFIKETSRFETSVCRSSGLKTEGIWRLCGEYVDPPAQQPAIGRAVGVARTVFDISLDFDADGVPFPQHANIIGWITDDTRPQEETKSFRMQQAQQVVAQMTYSPRPS